MESAAACVGTGLVPRFYDEVGRDGRPKEPQVEVETLPSWHRGQIGWDVAVRELTVADWLLIPQQRLLGIAQGPVFADPEGELAALHRGLPVLSGSGSRP